MKFKLQRNFLIHKQSSYENKLSKSISNLLIINVTKQTQRRRRKHTTRERDETNTQMWFITSQEKDKERRGKIQFKSKSLLKSLSFLGFNNSSLNRFKSGLHLL